MWQPFQFFINPKIYQNMAKNTIFLQYTKCTHPTHLLTSQKMSEMIQVNVPFLSFAISQNLSKYGEKEDILDQKNKIYLQLGQKV